MHLVVQKHDYQRLLLYKIMKVYSTRKVLLYVEKVDFTFSTSGRVHVWLGDNYLGAASSALMEQDTVTYSSLGIVEHALNTKRHTIHVGTMTLKCSEIIYLESPIDYNTPVYKCTDIGVVLNDTMLFYNYIPDSTEIQIHSPLETASVFAVVDKPPVYFDSYSEAAKHAYQNVENSSCFQLVVKVVEGYRRKTSVEKVPN